MADRIYIGLDIGTGGVRGCAIDGREQLFATAKAEIAGDLRRDPGAVVAAAREVLSQLAQRTKGQCHALSVAGTSGSLLGLDQRGAPVGNLSLYNDRPLEADRHCVLAASLPALSHGASPDVIARLMRVAADPKVSTIGFEAPFVASSLAGRFLAVDLNNALKAGCDPTSQMWPEFPEYLGISPECLPLVVEPGRRQGPMAEAVARELGFAEMPDIIAGTTDGCASALAAGLENTGDAVTSLGTTLTLKVLSDRPVHSAAHGIYSHRILGRWLAGGASNAGGAVLSRLFSLSEIETYSCLPVSDAPSATRYVPLVCSGERFPVVDPYLAPRLSPRPADDASYFLAILDGLTRWERRGYTALQASGGPRVRRLTAIGGGTRNGAWMDTRRRDLACDFFEPLSASPAFGAARLARFATESP